MIVGGEGPGDITTRGGIIKASVLEVDGTLYFTMPDNAWAVDARDGHELWHYFWKTKGGTHIGNRGLGMWNNYLFMETPDDYLVSLDAKTGKERWHKMIADVDEGYFSTPAPDCHRQPCPGGHGQRYRLRQVSCSPSIPKRASCNGSTIPFPCRRAIPGLDTWASLDAARHGGAQTWLPAPTIPKPISISLAPAIPPPPSPPARAAIGDNLFTCSLIALNVDTGKMAWYYQTSPHDMHDYDSAQTPVLVDGMFKGKMRKMVIDGSAQRLLLHARSQSPGSTW